MTIQPDNHGLMLRARAMLTASFAVVAALIAAVVMWAGGTSLGPVGAQIHVSPMLASALSAHDWTADLQLYRILRQTFPSATYVLPDENTISIPHLRRLAGAAEVKIDPAAALPRSDRDPVGSRYFASTYGPLELRGISVGAEAEARIDRGDHPGRSGQRVTVGKRGNVIVFVPDQGPPS